MDVLHKQKATHFKKTMDVSKTKNKKTKKLIIIQSVEINVYKGSFKPPLESISVSFPGCVLIS